MNENETSALDGLAGQVTADLLARSHLLAPEQIADALMDAAGPLGVIKARIYLADLEQRHLRAMPGGAGQSPAMLAIDSTDAGDAYRELRLRGATAGDGDPHQAWIPLVDGTERLGVLELTVTDMSDVMLARYETLASLAALMIVSKSHYSDTYAQTRRSQPMAVQAEMVWAFLAPRTFATDGVTVAAALEPAYEVGGDAYDYSIIGNRLHVSVFDAVGHDLAAGLLASVAMASCRSARRSGGTLQDIITRADHAVARQFGDSRYVTALLCELDVPTGVFTWIPCGHPPPLLIRGDKMIKELARRRSRRSDWQSRPQGAAATGHCHAATMAWPSTPSNWNPVTGYSCTPMASLRAAPPMANRSASSCSAISSSETATRAYPSRRYSGASPRPSPNISTADSPTTPLSS